MVFGKNIMGDISKFSKYHELRSGSWYLENFEILQASIIAKYYMQVMLLLILFIIEAEKFLVMHKRPFFLPLKKKKQTQASTFVTIFLHQWTK